MRILIKFPYNTHWKTKDRFIKKYKLVYPTDMKRNIVKDFALLHIGSNHSFRYTEWFIKFILELEDFFSGVDIWKIKKPHETNFFAKENYIDFVLEPKNVSATYYSAHLESA